MIKYNSVLVVGDIILDRLTCGSVDRISPEAPIPVVKIKTETQALGGAANVASNSAALGCRTGLIGAVGYDDAGGDVASLLLSQGIQNSVFHGAELETIIKSRILGNGQQVARLDFNDECRPRAADISDMLCRFEDILSGFDVVVISDYGKGVCTWLMCASIIKTCSRAGKTVIVDPKGTDWEKYFGATIVTPNLKEVSKMIGKGIKNTNADIEDKCRGLCNRFNIQYLLVTRAEQGMTLVDRENNFTHIHSKAKEIFDVTGAGDTVVAALAAFTQSADSMIDPVRLANTAAGIAVSKLGTSIVTLNEVLTATEGDRVQKKIVDLDTLMLKIKSWRSKKESVVFTNGCYDILHKGHAHSIYAAAEFGCRLIVAINSDASVKWLKGDGRPVNREQDRAYIIAAIGCVDAVIIFDDCTPSSILNVIRPDTIVKGGDYKPDDVVGGRFAGRVEIVDYMPNYSTTSLLSQLEVAWKD